MKKLDFLLECEVKTRELESLCLLKYELERRGYRVEIASCMEMRAKSRAIYEAEVFVVGGLRFWTNVSYVVGNAAKFNKVIEMPWEQTTNKSYLDRPILCDPIGIETVNVAWGELPKKRIVNIEKVDANRVFVCGHPAMDFCKSRFENYYFSREEMAQRYDLDVEKKWNLFTSSFSIEHMKEEDTKQLDEKNGLNLYQRLYKSETESKKGILNWIKNVVNVRKDQIFIYRPHPAEKLTGNVLELASKYKNFRIIRQEGVKQWLKVADKIYTWISTSTIEAFFMEKPCYVLRPTVVDEDIEMEIFSSTEVFIKDYESFYASIDKDAVEYPFSKEHIQKYYYYEKEKYTYMALADLCEMVYKDPKYVITEKTQQEIENYLIEKKRETPIREKINIKLKGSKLYGVYHRLFGKGTSNNHVYKKEIKDIEKRIKYCFLDNR